MIDLGLVLLIAVFSPLILGFISLLLNRVPTLANFWTLVSTLVPLGLALVLVFSFEPSAGFQFKFNLGKNLLNSHFDTSLKIALDGTSVFLFAFSTFIFPLAVVFSFRFIKFSHGLFGFLILLLETAVLGVFASTDIFFYYIFWELLLVPIFIITIIWGEEERRKAATTFLVYMFTGSLPLLVGIIFLGAIGANASNDKNIFFVTNYEKLAGLTFPKEMEMWLFALFAIPFLFKAPMAPFHTWLPKMYRSAPVSVIITGITLKMATYGLIRFNLILFHSTSVTFAPIICGIAVFTIVYAGLIALRKENIFDVLSYSSISHLGFILLGLFAMTTVSIQGAIFQMGAHALSTSLLFCIAYHLYKEQNRLAVSDYRGLKKTHPFLSTIFLIGVLASIGLPGLSGFIGEFLILSGSWQSNSLVSLSQIYVSVAVLGILLSAAYMLPLFQKIFLGEYKLHVKPPEDFSIKEKIAAIVFVIGIIWMGLSPQTAGMLSYTEEASSSVSKGNYNEIISKKQRPPGPNE